MRMVERTLVVANISSSLVLGFWHVPIWFALLGTTFLLYVLLADRALRRQIGDRHWPSEGYARFAFNTNLYFAFCQLVLGSVLFAAAGTLPAALGIQP